MRSEKSWAFGRHPQSNRCVHKVKEGLMKNLRLGVVVVSAALFLPWAPVVWAIDEPVQLTHGLVSGVELDDGMTVFRGIPFAAPPVAELRWKAPQPPIRWEGVRPADTFGPACLQGRDVFKSEDCLYLNVWTKAESLDEGLPVMVWIHGGGWSSGASSRAVYDGVGFADKGIVLVSVNYRMNAFGFMAHPALSAESERGVSGNYGILDHIAALEWVRDNVRGFGGDPNNVTIFGESAGGASIYALLATPLAKGLFHRAISESTWITSTNVTHLIRNNGFSDSAEVRGERAVAEKLAELGRSADGDLLTAMRELTAAEIMSMRFNVSLAEDGWVLPKSPREIFAEGSQNVVPLLAGVNDGEGLLFVRADRTFTTLEEQRDTRVEQWGTHGEGLAAYYLADKADDILAIEVDYNTDSWFARPNREILTSMARTPAETFMYLFTRNLRDPSELSPHAMELRYVFQTLPDDASEVDRRISDLMSDYWVQFAKSGNPNREGLPPWPTYDAEVQEHQIIGAEVGQGLGFRREALNELDRYFAATYDSAERSDPAAATTRTKWPPLFPRAGATKVLETDRVIVWDQEYTAHEVMHKHIRDILVFAVDEGPIRVTTPENVPTVGAQQVGAVSPDHTGLPRVIGYFEAGLGPHSEVIVDPSRPRRFFFVEFKGTEPADCGDWSTACD